jgi:hypothetical protein
VGITLSYKPSGVTTAAIPTRSKVKLLRYVMPATTAPTPLLPAESEPRIVGQRVEWRNRPVTDLDADEMSAPAGMMGGRDAITMTRPVV